MKGLSTILAMILIVIITVALIGLTYTFASGLITTTTTGAQNQTTTMTQNLQKTVIISGASCINTTPAAAVIWTNVTFTVKATGANGISGTAHELSAALDGADISTGTNEYGPNTTLITSSSISPGKIQTYVFAYSNKTPGPLAGNTTSRLLVVSSPAGSVSYTIPGCKI